MDGTILGQGTFTANSANLANPNPGNAEVGQANPTIIQIPSNADWVRVLNFTQFGTEGSSGSYFNGVANAYAGVEFYWQRGMAAGTAIAKYYGNGNQGLYGDTLLAGGFTLYDPSGQSVGAQPFLGTPVAVSAVTNATRPAVTHTADTTVVVGSIVRLYGTAQTDVNGVDMVVGTITDSTHFTLLTATNTLATAPGAIGGAGFYSLVNFDPLYYPRRRFVVNITQATNAQVSTSVPHQYVAGQAVRFTIPAVSGMVQLNPGATNNYMYSTVLTVVDAYNFTIDTNTSAYTAFTWPTIAQQPSSFPIVEPIGENSASALLSTQAQTPVDAQGNLINNANVGFLSDSTINTGYLGMILGAGGNGKVLTTPILGPSGSISWSAGNAPTGDTMYWLAGKSTYGGL